MMKEEHVQGLLEVSKQVSLTTFGHCSEVTQGLKCLSNMFYE